MKDIQVIGEDKYIKTRVLQWSDTRLVLFGCADKPAEKRY
jgi:hypothetical protein